MDVFAVALDQGNGSATFLYPVPLQLLGLGILGALLGYRSRALCSTMAVVSYS